ncbi:hypothetical protein KCP70_08970 [Salmonella enterica subsp. enterica]|nr:hypothetical protein KCP70_08970 [Salmonella enterica subsp. enterica]
MRRDSVHRRLERPWCAADADGNVDVTTLKTPYADVATDSSVKRRRAGVDAGYTNNEPYTSPTWVLVASKAEHQHFKQVSGAQATTVFAAYQQPLTTLADAAPHIKDGLGVQRRSERRPARSRATTPSTTCWHYAVADLTATARNHAGVRHARSMATVRNRRR